MDLPVSPMVKKLVLARKFTWKYKKFFHRALEQTYLSKVIQVIIKAPS